MPWPQENNEEALDLARLIETDYEDRDDPLTAAWHALANEYQARFGNPYYGMYRMTFDGGDGFVYKVPRNWSGVGANENEAAWNDSSYPVAACEIILEMPSGIPVLKMEKVEPATEIELPEWTMISDCQQVGYNAKGELVIYDL